MKIKNPFFILKSALVSVNLIFKPELTNGMIFCQSRSSVVLYESPPNKKIYLYSNEK